MDDLISRQAAIDYLMTNMAWYNEDGYEEDDTEKLAAITDLINGVPSAESERKTGTWIDVNGDGSLFRCDQCFETVCCRGNKFCPDCGVRMEVEG